MSEPDAVPAQQTRRVWLTGFGPFPGVVHNPTAQFANALAGWRPSEWPLVEVVSTVFPTEWQGLPQRRKDALERLQPDLCLHLGVHGRATALHVEDTAYNLLSFGRPDAAGLQLHDTPIEVNGPEAWHTPFLADAVAQALNDAQLPALVSHDPGRYLCNALYALALQDGRAAPPALFLHIPMPGQPMDGRETTWTMQALDQAVRQTLTTLLTQIAQHQVKSGL